MTNHYPTSVALCTFHTRGQMYPRVCHVFLDFCGKTETSSGVELRRTDPSHPRRYKKKIGAKLAQCPSAKGAKIREATKASAIVTCQAFPPTVGAFARGERVTCLTHVASFRGNRVADQVDGERRATTVCARRHDAERRGVVSDS